MKKEIFAEFLYLTLAAALIGVIGSALIEVTTRVHAHVQFQPSDCCKKLGAANDARSVVDESHKAMRAGLRYIEEGLPQDRVMRADAREKLATAIVNAEVWLEATK